MTKIDVYITENLEQKVLYKSMLNYILLVQVKIIKNLSVDKLLVFFCIPLKVKLGIIPFSSTRLKLCAGYSILKTFDPPKLLLYIKVCRLTKHEYCTTLKGCCKKFKFDPL